MQNIEAKLSENPLKVMQRFLICIKVSIALGRNGTFLQQFIAFRGREMFPCSTLAESMLNTWPFNLREWSSEYERINSKFFYLQTVGPFFDNWLSPILYFDFHFESQQKIPGLHRTGSVHWFSTKSHLKILLWDQKYEKFLNLFYR